MPRPPLPPDERRSEVLQLRLRVDEREQMDIGAALAGEPVTEFVRNAGLERAERLQQESSRKPKKRR